MKKRLLLVALAIAIVIILAPSAWLITHIYTDYHQEDEEMEAFIEDKYGMDATIISKNNTIFIKGKNYQVAFEEQKDVVFNVAVNEEEYSTIYRDDYQPVLEYHNMLAQFETLMPEIEKLGFSGYSAADTLRHVVVDKKTGETVRWLELETTSSYKTPEAAEIEALMKLLDFQRKKKLQIQSINITNKQEKDSIELDIQETEKVQNAEELQSYLIQKYPHFLNESLRNAWQDAATQAETERFRFHDEKAKHWLTCREADAEGNCTDMTAIITFEPGQLDANNPDLEKDLDAIFGVLDSLPSTGIALDVYLKDTEREGEPVYLNLQDRSDYPATKELIDALIKS